MRDCVRWYYQGVVKRYISLVFAVLLLGLLLLVVSDILGTILMVKGPLDNGRSGIAERYCSDARYPRVAASFGDTALVLRVELGNTTNLVLRVVGSGLVEVDYSNGEEDLTLLLAVDGVKVEAARGCVSLGGAELVERDSSEGDELVDTELRIEDLEVESIVFL